MRKGVIAANWKMNGRLTSSIEYAKNIGEFNNVDVIVAPPSVYIRDVYQNVAGKFSLAAQTGSENEDGAFTGELSMQILKDSGCEYVILGHSERRAIFKETELEIYNKTKKALEVGLTPIFCIGETDAENQAGDTEKVLREQLKRLIENTPTDELKKIILAYEPVWAIGTGRTPSIDEINTTHKNIRGILDEKDGTISAAVRIVYGGSVKPSNAEEIFACENVDGGLIGGASLTVDSFEQIIKAYK